MRILPGHVIRALVVLLLSGVSMIWAAQLLAMDCSPDNIVLSSQADIDDFQENHGPCDRVVGVLTIDGADIENVNGLSALTSIGDGLRFLFTSSLNNIDGLSSISSIDGYLFFTDCESLTQIDGLSNLLTVGGSVHFQFNDALVNLNGLSTLTSAGSLIIEFNTALLNLDGLSSLTDVELNVHLESNTALTSLQGLSSLTSVGGNLKIRDIGGLVDLQGLHNIPSLGGDLLIRYNHGLLSADLKNLAAVNGKVTIQNNDGLTQLDGLSGLIGVGEDLLVGENPSLGECAGLTRLLDDVDDGESGPGPGASGIPDVGNEVNISNNLSGCNSVEEILKPIFQDGFENPENIITVLNDPTSEVGEQNSIAIGSDGYPVISYHDRTTGSLKVAKCSDIACAGGNEIISTVDDPENSVGWYNSLVIGTDGNPVISYHDESAGALKVAKCNDAACAGDDETITTIDGLTSNVGDYSSLAIGTDGFPVISYYDRSFGNLKVAKCNDAACAGGDETVTTVDGLASNLGLWSSIAIGVDGFPVIGYNDFFPVQSLKVAKCNDTACSGGDEIITTVDGVDTDVGHYISLAIGADGFPIISYLDFSAANALKTVKCNDTACAGGDEIITTVDDPINDVGAWTSLAIGTDDFPVISYFDSTAGALKVAKCNDASCSGGDEIVSTVDNPANTVGLLSSIVIGIDGFPVISYLDNTEKTLKVLHCGTPSCGH